MERVCSFLVHTSTWPIFIHHTYNAASPLKIKCIFLANLLLFLTLSLLENVWKKFWEKDICVFVHNDWKTTTQSRCVFDVILLKNEARNTLSILDFFMLLSLEYLCAKLQSVSINIDTRQSLDFWPVDMIGFISFLFDIVFGCFFIFAWFFFVWNQFYSRFFILYTCVWRMLAICMCVCNWIAKLKSSQNVHHCNGMIICEEKRSDGISQRNATSHFHYCVSLSARFIV